ncbi:hypothetical protein ACLX1H_005509 [Fusarium chlamydosporum]
MEEADSVDTADSEVVHIEVMESGIADFEAVHMAVIDPDTDDSEVVDKATEAAHTAAAAASPRVKHPVHTQNFSVYASVVAVPQIVAVSPSPTAAPSYTPP